MRASEKAAAVLQLTWGLPQTLVGAIVSLFAKKGPLSRFRSSVVVPWKWGGGMSLGLFIFAPLNASERFLSHEYGHCLQSMILGPLYLLAAGLPSLLWAWLPIFNKLRARHNRSYYSFYTERWADALAKIKR